jgi:type VI secretion system protein ImpL
MKKALKILLWLLALLLLAALCWAISLWNEWPPLTPIVLFIGAIGLYFLARFVWMQIDALRARSVTATPVEKPEPEISAESALKRKWKDAIALLKQSNLRQYGNPLYVLPWYMVIGRSGSGKTTALTRARLSSPLRKVNPNATVEQTLNVDWWYFDKAIVLDTAGRYIAPEEIDADRAEWDKMLDFLGHYRAKEGLNGLVLTIQADRLLKPEPDALAEEGRVIRMRIEQLIRLFDKRFPVYVLVTKSDLLYGMEAWSRLLPEGLLDQAMGYVSSDTMDGQQNEVAFLDTAFEQMGARLKTLQLAIMQRLEGADPALLLFPSEFARLQGPLKTFLRHALGDSPYLEEPFLRGVFFASGLQEGGAVSAVMNDITPHEPKHEPVLKGLFLHDLFDRVLPTDRFLLRPAAIVNHWRRLNRRLGVTAWLLLVVAAAGYLSFSFVHSLNTLNKMREMYPQSLALTGHLPHDVEALAEFRDFAYWLEKRDAQTSNRLLAFDGQLRTVESRIKGNYVAMFRKYVLPSLDDALARRVQQVIRDGQSDHLADYIQTEVRRINLVQARLNGATHEELRAMPPLSGSVLFEMDPSMSQDDAAHFNDMYVALLAWQPNDLFRQQRLVQLQDELKQIALNSPTFDWVVAWANAQPDLHKVQLSDYWRGSGHPAGLPEVPAAFTRDGKQRIDAFMQEVRKSAPNVGSFDDKLATFNQWYGQAKLQVWRDFAWNFSQGERTLAGENEWRGAISRLPGADSPYQQLSNRLAGEFKDLSAEARPSWLTLNQRLFEVRQRAQQQALLNVPGTINDIGGKLLKDMASGGAAEEARSQITAQLDAIKLYQAYAAALNQAVGDAVVSPAKAAKVAADFHGYDSSADSKSALHTAYTRLADLRAKLGAPARPDDQVAWGLLAGPLQLAVRYVDQQASCTMQKDWDSKVMAPLQSAAGMPELADKLYGDNGALWGFLNGSAKPFVQRGADAYQLTETLGQTVPLAADFLPFVNAAIDRQVGIKVGKQQKQLSQQRSELALQQQKQQLQLAQQKADGKLAELSAAADKLRAASYPVTITGLPSGLNAGAKTNVLATVLSVQCASAPLRLNNLNFAVTESFSWSQQSCGDTTLQIKLPTFTLTKRYQGPQGFVAFLREFQKGSHSFSADDFALDKARLDGVAVSELTVRYRFSGQETLLKQANQLAHLEEGIAAAQADKQEATQGLSELEQQLLQSKAQGLEQQDAPMTVKVPGKIGQCWNSEIKTAAPAKTARQLIDELVASKLAVAAASPAPAAKPAAVVPSKPAAVPVPAPAPAVSTDGALVTGQLPEGVTALRQALASAQGWLAKDGRYTVQISQAKGAASADARLQKFAATLDAGKLLAYPGSRSSFVISYGNLASAEEAKQLLASLPAEMQAFGPMVRSSQAVRGELGAKGLYR